MIEKKNVLVIMMLLTFASFLCGCSKPGTAQGNTVNNNTTPAISQPATPTPDSSTDTGLLNTITPVEPTATLTPTPTPTPTATPTPVPEVPTAPVTVNTDIETDSFLINRDYPLTEEYIPDDLTIPNIKFSFTDQTSDKRKLRKNAADALEELCNTAFAENGLTIYGVSGYRSYDRQYDIYGSNLIKRGIRHTNLYSAAPGTSEHQTGLAIDVSCKSIGYALDNRFAETEEGLWLKENAWRFGYILRYPKEKEAITGYAYEPWHIRYVGVPLAYYLHTNDMTLEEYYGSPSTHKLSDLADTPLINMHTTRFYLLYAKTFGSEPYYDANGNILMSRETGFPLLKEKITDSTGKEIEVNGSALFIEPVYDVNGDLVLDAKGNVLYTKPYFDAEGNLWLDYSGAPVFLQPLWNADGTLAYDRQGNLLYTEVVLNNIGLEFITESGAPLVKVPMRDTSGKLIFKADGTALFYEPFIIPETNEIIIDTGTLLPLYPSAYYDVPQNTYPYPADFVLPTDDSFFYQEDIPADDSFWDTAE